MTSAGALEARSKLTCCAYDVSRRPCPVPSCDSADLAASSLRERAPAAGELSEGGPGKGCPIGAGGGVTFLRKTATPITPTSSGRPVRAAYESGSDVK